MAKKPTISDVLEAVNGLASHMDERFSELDQKFATKDDLKSSATKADLERFATKADLERFATKEDLERFATKEDLADLETRITTGIDRFVVLHQRMDVELISTRARFERIEDKLERNNIR